MNVDVGVRMRERGVGGRQTEKQEIVRNGEH